LDSHFYIHEKTVCGNLTREREGTNDKSNWFQLISPQINFSNGNNLFQLLHHVILPIIEFIIICATSIHFLLFILSFWREWTDWQEYFHGPPKNIPPLSPLNVVVANLRNLPEMCCFENFEYYITKTSKCSASALFSQANACLLPTAKSDSFKNSLHYFVVVVTCGLFSRYSEVHVLSSHVNDY